MSHVSVCQVEVRSLEALGRAVRRMGGELVLGQRTFRWYGSFANDSEPPRELFLSEEQYREFQAGSPRQRAAIVEGLFAHCEHAVRFPGVDYEVGLVRRGDRWVLLADTWSYGGLAGVLGDGSKLRQLYAAEAVKVTAETLGYSWEEAWNAAGELEVNVLC